MTVIVPPPVASHAAFDGSAVDRHGQLQEQVAKAQTRAKRPDSARVLMVAGGVCLPAGLILILLGYSGVAHTTDVFEQMPYFVSGGVLGLALVFTGGFAYFAYWLSELVHSVRRDAAANRELLAEIASLLHANGQAAAASGRRPVRAEATPSRFVATPAGTVFHRPYCAVVNGVPGTRPVSGDEPGLAPCQLCQPV